MKKVVCDFCNNEKHEMYSITGESLVVDLDICSDCLEFFLHISNVENKKGEVQ